MGRRVGRAWNGALLLAAAALRSGPAEAAWPTDPQVNLPVCTAQNQQQFPVLIEDGAHGAIITWQDLRAGANDIYAQRVLSGGGVDPAWPANGVVVCFAQNTQSFPAIVSDGVSGALIAWQDVRGGIFNDIYVQHVLSTGRVDLSWPENGQGLCLATGHQVTPTGVVDGAGGAIFAWRDQRSSSDGDVYAQHVLASGAVDPAWPANGRALCFATGIQQSPRAVADGSGGAIVVWQDARSGTGTDDIYAQHVRADGTVDPAWPLNGRLVCGAAGAQLSPTMVSDGSGGLIATWYDQRAGTTNSDIYAQRVLGSGAVDSAWPADGRALCTAAANQRVPMIVSDGAHGAIVTWSDQRATDTAIYAQRILASGIVDPAWPADGRAICVAPNSKFSPKIETDGIGGAIIAWSDFRANPSIPDLYVAHVRGSGIVDPGWTADGNALCTAAGTQTVGMLIPDGVGGVIATWADHRHGDGNIDIYAQRVQANGQLGGTTVDVAPDAPAPLAVMVHPNPSRAGTLLVSYSLASGGPAWLELLDVTGRRVALRVLDASGAGHQTLRLGEGSGLPPGLYFVRLNQGVHRRTARVALIQ